MITVRIVEIDEELEFLTKVPNLPKKGDQICCFFPENDFRVCEIISIRYYFLNSGKFDEIEIGVKAC